ncbi:MAG: phosphoglycerate dehydrogenase, partial [Caulobacteraceae bacterium]|nr:phosphoglycerate dehydrogenase [Caulobacter sp.]
FTSEPASENVLFGAPNFVATPHLGASTLEAQENVALQVAEQISDHLNTGAITNALNSPSVSAEEAPRLKPFIDLAGKLGSLAGQMVDAGLTAVEIAFEGQVADFNTRPVTAAALAGVLRPMLAEVNMVSAPELARARGIAVTESRNASSPVYDSLVRVAVVGAGGRRAFAGAVIGGSPRVTEVKGVELEAPLSPAMLYVNNTDRPGFIGAVGASLAQAGVNIATFNLGRVEAGGDAHCLIGVDQPLDEALLAHVRALPQVREARSLAF